MLSLENNWNRLYKSYTNNNKKSLSNRMEWFLLFQRWLWLPHFEMGFKVAVSISFGIVQSNSQSLKRLQWLQNNLDFLSHLLL